MQQCDTLNQIPPLSSPHLSREPNKYIDIATRVYLQKSMHLLTDAIYSSHVWTKVKLYPLKEERDIAVNEMNPTLLMERNLNENFASQK